MQKHADSTMAARLMRPRPVVALLAALFLCLNACAPAKSYSYAADGFRATFPSHPELSKDNVPEGQINIELRSYTATDPVSGAIFMVGVADYGTRLEGKDPDTILQGAENGALANSKSQLVGSHRKIFLGKYHGLAFEAGSAEMHLSMRLYWVESTLYQEIVLSPKARKLGTAATERFLDSFELIPRQ